MYATDSYKLFRFLTLTCLFRMSSTLKPLEEVGEASSLHVGVQSVKLVPNSINQQQSEFYRSLAKKQNADQSLQFMLSLYQRAADADGRPRQPRMFGCNTVRLIRPFVKRKRQTPAILDHKLIYTLDYHLSVLPNERLMRATFIHLRSSARSFFPVACEVSISSLPASEKGAPSAGTVVLGSLDHWAETDATPQLLSQSGRRLSLAVEYSCVRDVPLGPEEADKAQQQSSRRGMWTKAMLRSPALLLYLEEDRDHKGWAVPTSVTNSSASRRTRSRRSKEPGNIGSDIPNYERRSNVRKNHCRLHQYRVTFRDLGWDHWIIAPHGYNPRYCKGDCPRVLHYGYSSPNHAIVQNFISEMMAGEVPPPSCVPLKYKPISVLMMEKNGTVTYKEYEDMIAESCTCR